MTPATVINAYLCHMAPTFTNPPSTRPEAVIERLQVSRAVEGAQDHRLLAHRGVDLVDYGGKGAALTATITRS
jgi:hypothetical protein